MKTFAIRNEEDKKKKDLGYLIYYEKEKRFYIELPDDADPWETPLLLSSCLKRGEKTIMRIGAKTGFSKGLFPQIDRILAVFLKIMVWTVTMSLNCLCWHTVDVLRIIIIW